MNKINVLLVEDNQSQADYVASHLKSDKYNVQFLIDGQEAFDLLSEKNSGIEVVIVDYYLPGINGIELIQKLTDSGFNYGFVFISIDQSIETFVSAMKAGAYEFIHKNSNLKVDLPVFVDKAYTKFLQSQNKQKIEDQVNILSNAVEQSGSTIIITDCDGRIQYANKKFEQTTGYTIAETIGENPKIMKSGDKPESYYKNLWDTIKSGNSWKGEFINKRKNGELYYEEAIISPVKNPHGEIICFIAVKDDITARKHAEMAQQESERRFRTLFEQAAVGVALVDSITGHFLRVNKRHCEIFGYTETELLQQNFQSITFPEDLQADLDNMKMLIDGKINEFTMEKRHVRKNGKVIWTELTVSPMWTDETQPKTHIAVVVDITQRKWAENCLHESREKLEQLNATKDKFFSIIAHDLKNPFNSILGFSDLLLQNIHRYDQLKIEMFLNTIKNSSKQAYDLLENLLVWARSQTGKIDYSPEPVDLNQRFSDNLGLLEAQTLNKKLKITTNIPDDTLVYGDKNMINTVIRNLVSNAIKFTFENGSINISVIDKDDMLEIAIKDNGIGIAPENLNKLFRIDSKYSTSGTNEERGTGLGLILCKEFVEKQGGKIWVESVLEKGSTFRFTLPKV